MARRVETEYRYIVKTPGVCGGAAVIRGSRTPVRSIVGYYKLGLPLEDILLGLPHLTPAQVFEALSYYHDNIDEIERDIAENQKNHLLERYGLQVDSDGHVSLAG